ncbi:MAG TPA: pyridoxamine 5'-phosphate oxidase [Longimicrobiales bacterium]|nr:pyridoxamine 5'-phosphate oxidase [Longimicrobiales bacterium]
MKVRAALRLLRTLGGGVLAGAGLPAPAEDPIAAFQRWLRDAEASGILLPEAMSLATATPQGAPSSRMLLLKAADESGFLFYTNYASRKAAELDANPRAALLFHWAALQRQVRIEGRVVRLTPAEVEAYFRTRPRGSRIGAWASRQSAPLDSRETLEERVRAAERRFGEGEVPCPPFWGGYRLVPDRLEFWQGRTARLHDRLAFQREGPRWRSERLYP